MFLCFSVSCFQGQAEQEYLTLRQPGYPDGNTRDGYGSMMEVGYVALYTSGQGRGASQQQSPLDTLGS